MSLSLRGPHLGISRSLGPLREVVASLVLARRGSPPAGTDRRRIVRRVRAAGVAAIPSLVRALGSQRKDEATWASYLLGRLGGERVAFAVSRLLEDPRTSEEASARAIELLGGLNEHFAGPRPVADPPSLPPLMPPGRSVQELLASLETDEDLDHAVGLIRRDIPDDELPAFLSEVAQFGGELAVPLLDALLAAGRFSRSTRSALRDLRARLPDEPACTVRVRHSAGGRAIDDRRAQRGAPKAPGHNNGPPRMTVPDRSRAFDLLEAGRIEEARPLLERVVEGDPDDGEALSFLGVCFLELGLPGAALPHLEHAVAIEPDEPLHQWNLAAAARADQRLSACYGALHRYLELHDGAPGVRERRREARAFVRAWERTVALSHPGTNPGLVLDGERVFLAAFDAFCARRYQEAIGGFERVLALVPDHFPSWGNLGAAWLALGRHEEALRCLRRALELNPGYEVARANLRRLEDA
ncbi:MAG: tetratricopeptide repeat protein [Myxococcales bacterium]|nr:tetratricopeptide repeat protein [Myxococcales bacterium]